MEQSEVSFLSIPSWNPPRITPSSLKIDRITSLLLAIMNENEILATHQVQADGLNGKDAKETKQLQTVRGRSPNPAPDRFVCVIDFMNLSAKQLHKRTASGSQQVRVCFLACFFGKYESACAIFVLKGLLTNFTYLILNWHQEYF